MSFGSNFEEHSDVMSEINMTPLVDVMLVLLIIFMLTVPVLTHAVKLNLPQATNQQENTKQETINISITADGSAYWDEQKVSQDVLKRHLKDIAVKQPQPEIHIRGDRKTQYEYIVDVMNDAQNAGIQKLSFVTTPAIK